MQGSSIVQNNIGVSQFQHIQGQIEKFTNYVTNSQNTNEQILEWLKGNDCQLSAYNPYSGSIDFVLPADIAKVSGLRGAEFINKVNSIVRYTDSIHIWKTNFNSTLAPTEKFQRNLKILEAIWRDSYIKDNEVDNFQNSVGVSDGGNFFREIKNGPSGNFRPQLKMTIINRCNQDISNIAHSNINPIGTSSIQPLALHLSAPILQNAFQSPHSNHTMPSPQWNQPHQNQFAPQSQVFAPQWNQHHQSQFAPQVFAHQSNQPYQSQIAPQSQVFDPQWNQSQPVDHSHIYNENASLKVEAASLKDREVILIKKMESLNLIISSTLNDNALKSKEIELKSNEINRLKKDLQSRGNDATKIKNLENEISKIKDKLLVVQKENQTLQNISKEKKGVEQANKDLKVLNQKQKIQITELETSNLFLNKKNSDLQNEVKRLKKSNAETEKSLNRMIAGLRKIDKEVECPLSLERIEDAVISQGISFNKEEFNDHATRPNTTHPLTRQQFTDAEKNGKAQSNIAVNNIVRMLHELDDILEK